MLSRLPLLLACLLLSAAAWSQPDIPMIFHARSIPFNGGSISYIETGRGRPLLLLHGGFQDRSMWRDQVLHFNNEFRVIAVDMPGHGATVDGPQRPDAAAVVRTLLDSLHIDKVSIVGLSFGSAVALEFASRYPARVEKLVMASPGIAGWDEDHAILPETLKAFGDMNAALERRDTAGAARQFVEAWYVGPARRELHLLPSLYKYGISTTLRNMQEHHASGWPDFAKPSTIHRVKDVTMPVLIMTGTADMPEVARVATWLQANLPAARSVRLLDAAHMINLELPTRFNRELLRFLRER
ncbi:alpha/beta fold hydrolase [Flaviaesturariibacter terrae]